MNSTEFCRHVMALVFFVAAVSTATAGTAGSSPADPAPAGVTLNGIIECGQGYTSHELYDMKITLVEVVRGEEAWKRIKEASPSNKQADPGFDYILAHVKSEYYARGTPGSCIHQLIPDQFTSYSADGNDYKSVVVVPPKPEMRKDLKAGESLEGWLVFMVAKEDKGPLMPYSADRGGAIVHGGGKWFVLR